MSKNPFMSVKDAEAMVNRICDDVGRELSPQKMKTLRAISRLWIRGMMGYRPSKRDRARAAAATRP